MRQLALLAIVPACATPAAQDPLGHLYITLVSHNEDLQNADCAALLAPTGDDSADRARYLANREAVLALADATLAAGVDWDFMSDWAFADAAAGYGDDLIEELATRSPEHLVVDAHSHEHLGHSYADVAEQLEQLGAPSTGIVGGFLAAPADAADWARFRDEPMLADDGWAFGITALWGGASGLHVDDPHVAGVWRPASEDDYYTDDETSPLPNIGTWDAGDDPAASFAALAARVEAGEMLTASVTISQCRLAQELDDVRAMVAELGALVADGVVISETLPEIVRIWREAYGARPSIVIE